MKLEIKTAAGETIQTLHLAEGEYLVSVGPPPSLVRKTSVASPLRDSRYEWLWVLGVTLALLILRVGHYALLETQTQPTKYFWQSLLKDGSALLFACVLASVLSKAVLREFHVIRTARLAMAAVAFFVLYDYNLLGLRWVLPELFSYPVAFDVLMLAAVGGVLWRHYDFFFPRLNSRLPFLLLSLFGIVFTGLLMLEHYPNHEGYKYLAAQTAPPQIELAESAPVGIEELLRRVGVQDLGEDR